MSFYTESVLIEPLPNGRWRLASDLVWEIGEKGSGYTYAVAAGFETDLASIPWFARMFLDRGDARLAKAAILHDHMMERSGFSRITSSAEFAAALLADRVSKWKVLVMGLSVLIWNLK